MVSSPGDAALTFATALAVVIILLFGGFIALKWRKFRDQRNAGKQLVKGQSASPTKSGRQPPRW